MIPSTAYFSAASTISDRFLTIALSVPYQEKIIALVRSLFFPAQAFFLGCYGSHQLILERAKPFEQLCNDQLKNCASRLNSFLQLFLFEREYERIPCGYHAAHGALYLSSGICKLSTAFNAHPVHKTLGDLAGSGFFLLASIMGLEHNVNIYRQAHRMDLSDAPQYLHDAVKLLKNSAIMGIVSNLNYVLLTVSIYCGAPFALALLFAVIAPLTGCLKILYDYYYIY